MARGEGLTPVDRFVMNCTTLTSRRFVPSVPRSLAPNLTRTNSRIFQAFASVGSTDFLNQMLYLDSKIFMTRLNLMYNDKMSMASSVEVRVPFLDRELAEFVAWHVPPSKKVKGRLFPSTKYIFRKAMEGMLPEEIVRQPKAGFGAPVDYWLSQDLKEMVDDLLAKSQLNKRGMFRASVVDRMTR